MSYNRIAPIYDFLSRLVFGRELEMAQQCHVNSLRGCEKILILGGGTGRVLDGLSKIGFHGEVVFLDLSEGMLKRAKRRRGELNIRFELADAFDYREKGFDGFHMAFFLDQFHEQKIMKLVDQLKSMATTDSIWIVTDFIKSTNWSGKALLTLMYRFFSLTSGIETDRLPDWQEPFIHFHMIGTRPFANGKVISTEYRYSQR